MSAVPYVSCYLQVNNGAAHFSRLMVLDILVLTEKTVWKYIFSILSYKGLTFCCSDVLLGVFLNSFINDFKSISASSRILIYIIKLLISNFAQHGDFTQLLISAINYPSLSAALERDFWLSVWLCSVFSHKHGSLSHGSCQVMKAVGAGSPIITFLHITSWAAPEALPVLWEVFLGLSLFQVLQELGGGNRGAYAQSHSSHQLCPSQACLKALLSPGPRSTGECHHCHHPGLSLTLPLKLPASSLLVSIIIRAPTYKHMTHSDLFSLGCFNFQIWTLDRLYLELPRVWWMYEITIGNGVASLLGKNHRDSGDSYRRLMSCLDFSWKWCNAIPDGTLHVPLWTPACFLPSWIIFTKGFFFKFYYAFKFTMLLKTSFQNDSNIFPLSQHKNYLLRAFIVCLSCRDSRQIAV